MPLKDCRLCGAEYWARWRNTPAICEACALHAVVCPGCWTVKLREPDPAQLALFSLAELERRGVWPSLDVALRNHFANQVPRRFDWESYTEHLLTTRPAHHHDHVEPAAWPRKTSLAARRRQPFH